MTVDGFFAGPNGEIDWHVVGPEFNEYAIGMLNTIDTFLFGRVTYDLMASYWPTPEAIKNDPIVAEKMNSLAKVVFSKTVQKAEWNNSTMFGEIVPADIMKMKQAAGKDIAIFGSGTIVSTLTDLGLIDEYRLIVNPVILGKGKSLFATLEKSRKLKLQNTKPFLSGNVLLYYSPA